MYIYIYIYRHVFCPSQDLSVWLMSTSREQLMSPECSKHQVLSFAKMLMLCQNQVYFIYVSAYSRFFFGCNYFTQSSVLRFENNISIRVVKALDSQSRGPTFKTARWHQSQLSLSSFRGR